MTRSEKMQYRKTMDRLYDACSERGLSMHSVGGKEPYRVRVERGTWFSDWFSSDAELADYVSGLPVTS